MKLKDLTLISCNLDAMVSVRELAKMFETHADWPGVIMMSGGQFEGFISRKHFFEVLGKPFGIEVYSRKTILEFYNSFTHDYLFLEAETLVQEAVKTALSRERSQIFEPIIVKLAGYDFRVLQMHDLLLAQCDLLETLSDEFHQLSLIDPLTQIRNRRGFFESVQPEIQPSHEMSRNLSALMIDIDNFKKVNDLYGHFIGDHMLRVVAEEIQATLRQTDLIGRFGGEEFIALLPSTSVEAAYVIAERLRSAIEHRVEPINQFSVSVTVSIGICHIQETDGSLDALLSQADQAMYWAKDAGRNHVTIWTKDFALFNKSHASVKIKAISSRNNKNPDQIAKIYDETIEGWSKAIEMRDKEMQGHSKRVVDLTLRLAEKCGVRGKDLINIRRGALLHDIGKIAIPDPILFKPGKLSDEEWMIMRKHPVYAREFLSPIAFLKDCIDIPYCHHEHWDGSGYPSGLSGEEIPLSARIFTIIDVWDALRSDRCYRPAWSEEEAKNYIITQSGKMFDPHIIELFIQLLEEQNLTSTSLALQLQPGGKSFA